MLPIRITALLLTVALGGCSTLTSNYVRPELPNAPGWQVASEATPRIVNSEWWKEFKNRDIDALVAVALKSNPDIATASLRARRAVLQAERGGLSLFPTLSGSASSSGTLNLSENVGSQSNGVSFGASYEVDLWGKLASQKDAASLEAMATRDDIQAARMTVISSVIETYYRLAAINQQIAQARKSLEVAETTRALTETQVAAGQASDLDRQEAEQSLAGQKASLTDLTQSRVTLRNALTTLLNGQPMPIKEPTSLPRRTPIIVNAGLPADVLVARPDIRAAELRLRGTLKGVDAAKASLFPSLTLTGSLGSSSEQLIQVLSNPVATLGAGLALPFLNFREGQLAVKTSELQYQEAVIEFRKTLLAAFGDVAVALNARKSLTEKARYLQTALNSSTKAQEITGLRYQQGAIALRAWLDAQERTRSSEAAVTANRLEQMLNEIQLFRVLGTSPMQR